jgi:peptide/nickel transport system substrate-binding protein
VAKRRAQLSLVALTCGLGLLAASAVPSTASVAARNGGTFNISLTSGAVDFLDPALAYLPASWTLLSATCAGLMRYPNKPPPAGLRIAPDVAAFPPRVSSDGKTYTFTLRKDARFSDGKPVRADAFARAISRLLDPGMKSPGAEYAKDIVGAEAVTAGTRTVPSGVKASGTRLVIRFTRPIPDFPLRTTMRFFCAVPPGLPPDPEGRAVFAAAGPYFVSEFIRGRRAVLRRNPYYRGGQPHHVDRFIVDMQAASPGQVLDQIEKNQADWGWVPSPFFHDPARGLARKYGGSRFLLSPGWALAGYVLNSHRPLFENNPSLRRAVNFAVDRPALLRGRGAGRAADQLVPPGIPGFRNAAIYPLKRPDVPRARVLARGHLRGRTAVLYAIDVPNERARAQVLVGNLERIGLKVDLKTFTPAAYFDQIDNPRAAFDIASHDWLPDYIDPYQYTNLFFDGRHHGGRSLARFDSPRYNRLMRRAARLRGQARYQAYADLDLRLSRDAAPYLIIGYWSEPTFVSNRVAVGCLDLTPYPDLAAVCLK